MKYKKPSNRKEYKFGDVIEDLGRGWIDYSMAPIEGLLGKDVFDTGEYNNKTIGKIAGVASDISAAAAPIVLNAVAPGAGTAAQMIGGQAGQFIDAPSTNVGQGGAGQLVNSAAPFMMAYGGEIKKDNSQALQDYESFKAHVEKARQAVGTNDADALAALSLDPSKPYDSNSLAADFKKLQQLRQDAGLGITEEASIMFPHIGQQMRGSLNSMFGTHFAYGGDLTKIQNGGTHEQNPNGGVPMGQNATVEEGETIAGNYVFSDRLKVNKTLAKEYNLPKKAIGKSFAEVSKMFEDESRPSDAISKRGYEREIANLTKAQESYKTVHDKPSGMQFNNGGDLSTSLAQLYTPEAVEGILAKLQELNIDPTKPLTQENINTLNEVYGASGVANLQNIMGTIPLGYNVGGRQPRSAYNPAGMSQDRSLNIPNNPYSDRLEKLQEYRDAADAYAAELAAKRAEANASGTTQPVRSKVSSINVDPKGLANMNAGAPNLKLKTGAYTPQSIAAQNAADQALMNSESGFNINNLSQYGSLARFAPVAADIATLAMLQKPEAKDTSMFNTNMTFDPNLIDMEQMSRDVEASGNATRNLIRNTRGNQGSMMANLVGSQLQTDRAIGSTAVNVNAANNQELARVQGLELNQAMQNAGKQMTVQDWNDRDLQNYEGLLMDSVGSVGQNIGAIGSEFMNMEMVKNLPSGYWTNMTGQVKYDPMTGKKLVNNGG